MATQGLVSVVSGGQILMKAVAGNDGYHAHELADRIAAEQLATPEAIYDAALDVGFGSEETLVVQDQAHAVFHGDEDLSRLYVDKFPDAHFNPRWEHGTADHVVIVDISDPHHPKIDKSCCESEAE